MSQMAEKTQAQMEEWIQNAALPFVQSRGIGTRLPLHFVSCDLEQKQLTIRMEVASWMQNRRGMQHGGMTMTGFDFAFGLLCLYYANPKMVTTVNLATDYLAAVKGGTSVIYRVWVRSLGKRMISVCGEAYEAHAPETLLATSTATFMVLDLAQEKPYVSQHTDV